MNISNPNCFYHPDQPAAMKCEKCNKPICYSCNYSISESIMGRYYNKRVCPLCYFENDFVSKSAIGLIFLPIAGLSTYLIINNYSIGVYLLIAMFITGFILSCIKIPKSHKQERMNFIHNVEEYWITLGISLSFQENVNEIDRKILSDKYNYKKTVLGFCAAGVAILGLYFISNPFHLSFFYGYLVLWIIPFILQLQVSKLGKKLANLPKSMPLGD